MLLIYCISNINTIEDDVNIKLWKSDIIIKFYSLKVFKFLKKRTEEFFHRPWSSKGEFSFWLLQGCWGIHLSQKESKQQFIPQLYCCCFLKRMTLLDPETSCLLILHLRSIYFKFMANSNNTYKISSHAAGWNEALTVPAALILLKGNYITDNFCFPGLYVISVSSFLIAFDA